MITTAKRKLESDLANLLKCIAFWTINLENQKIQIAENHDFNILYAYSLLDPS